MKLKDEVASVEPAKKMKELGVKQDSIWVWIESPCMNSGYECSLSWNSDPYLENYSAFTVAELGEMLPPSTYSMRLTISPDVWFCDSGLLIPRERAKTEADARAKMLIYLIKEGIIKTEEIGK